MTKFNIKSVAIIGAGPAGIASLYEFLHTNKDGTSTVGKEVAENPLFDKIVVFEQKSQAGGIWTPDIGTKSLRVPPQSMFDTEQYNNPDVIHKSEPKPEGVLAATVENPILVKVNPKDDTHLDWQETGVYPDLFTNIPSRFVRFSYQPNEEKYQDPSRTIYPFLSHHELTSRFSSFVEKEQLEKYIRFKTRIEEVYKDENNKWVITANHDKETVHEWYAEEFDAVVVANGHYTVPFIPHIPGLAEYSRKNPEVVIHAKAYKNVDEFNGKSVLNVGGSISTENLIQYIYPVARRLSVSRRGDHKVFPFINEAIVSEGIVGKPPIERIDPETGIVYFTDGSLEGDFDKILFTTGYHYHYPFLKKLIEVVAPSNASRVSGLYWDIFAIEDPTLAAVGVPVTGLKFTSIEAEAAAVAGIWSNSKDLPSKEEQRQWEQKYVASRPHNIDYHYYAPDEVQEKYIDKVIDQFASPSRYNPLIEDGKHIDDIFLGVANLEKLFYKLKNNELSIKDTLYRD
ncbi:uncharacterized protein KQ657_000817 [Scheffersomyces spartinae]|uniref:Thiol-specific monooxygenase n=1 Tax=Scheffersomyces spartinae TaxID=45513 RepID=A0A9P7V8Z0_9ASCO|nr:uncharacterized protein KQ657_000817 [Scheffersomyces spartinae]KAG7193399.1 hypothetical protein KQ657_000817 [Scheffersomyces spartinae]